MDDFEKAVIQLYPFLRRSALALTREREVSEDLVQDTVLTALAKRHLFLPGSNLKAWLYTILRNRFFTLKRKHREVEDPEGLLEANLSVQPNQHDRLEYLEALEIVSLLPKVNRDAVTLASKGFTYQEMSEALAVVEGTVKSRVGRGRKMLIQIANGEMALPKRTRDRKNFSGHTRPLITVNQPSPIVTPDISLSAIPAQRFKLIGRDLRQKTVTVYRLK